MGRRPEMDAAEPRAARPGSAEGNRDVWVVAPVKPAVTAVPSPALNRLMRRPGNAHNARCGQSLAKGLCSPRHERRVRQGSGKVEGPGHHPALFG